MSTSSTAPGDPGFFCCDHSRAAGEQLFGTMPRADVWLLLEHPGPWAAKALADNDLPPAINRWLSAPDVGRQVKPLLIRQEGTRGDGIAFFVAVADELEPRLYAFRLESYAD
ncbi:MAG: hypothetical protein JW910_19050, partial [Anaerolineae bacterium]|nr:hypothetical protein [Anaerolineae bacterium]